MTPINGSSLATLLHTPVPACRQECQENPACFAWTLDTEDDDGRCLLLGADQLIKLLGVNIQPGKVLCQDLYRGDVLRK